MLIKPSVMVPLPEYIICNKSIYCTQLGNFGYTAVHINTYSKALAL